MLLALPSTYLGMVEEDLLALPDETLGRLRLFGLGIGTRVNPKLRALVMPYDARLDDRRSPIRGTRSDFASRALRHFAEVVLAQAPHGSADEHRARVEAALSGDRVQAGLTAERAKLGQLLINQSTQCPGGLTLCL